KNVDVQDCRGRSPVLAARQYFKVIRRARLERLRTLDDYAYLSILEVRGKLLFLSLLLPGKRPVFVDDLVELFLNFGNGLLVIGDDFGHRFVITAEPSAAPDKTACC